METTRTVSQRSTRRGTVWALLGALILSIAALMVALSAAAPAEAKPRFKTVVKAFGNTAPITINSGPGVATPYPSTVTSNGFKRGKITDVTLVLDGYTHQYPDDVSVLVEGPGGRNAVVMADVGGGFFVSGVLLLLNDEAPVSLPESTLIAECRCKPTRGTTGLGGDLPSPSVYTAPARFPPYASSLGVFDGGNPNGTWKLFVYDDTGPLGGSFAEGWGVVIKAKVRR